MITYEQARSIVEAGLAHARVGQYPPKTIAVLDAAARLVAFGREDGSSPLRGDIART